jgi:DNA-directed RNA polymerase subunit RPC12/RpoP
MRKETNIIGAIVSYFNWQPDYAYQCEECGEYMSSFMSIDEMNFCPYCGRKINEIIKEKDNHV